jgi:hypothetical protein
MEAEEKLLAPTSPSEWFEVEDEEEVTVTEEFDILPDYDAFAGQLEGYKRLHPELHVQKRANGQRVRSKGRAGKRRYSFPERILAIEDEVNALRLDLSHILFTLSGGLDFKKADRRRVVRHPCHARTLAGRTCVAESCAKSGKLYCRMHWEFMQRQRAAQKDTTSA